MTLARPLLLAALLLASGCAAPGADPDPPPPPPLALSSADTHAVVVGVLRWEGGRLAPFPEGNRKDLELHRLLLARGVPASQARLLLDGEATRAAMEAALEEALDRAGPGSTLLFYYAGHGVKGADGAVHLANFDIGEDPSATGFPVSLLAERIAARFRGDRVVVLADCCFSGALRSVAEAAAAAGKAGVSLTSADVSNASTRNWTFTQTLIDALSGDPLADRDGDGTVALEEVAAEVGEAMKAREGQRHGFENRGLDPGWAWAAAGPRAGGGESVSHTDTVSPGSWATAPSGEGRETVRVREVRGEDRLVRFYRYSDAEDGLVAAGELRPLQFRRWPEGAAVRVLWGGREWDAVVEKVEGDFHCITYPGWARTWDEWVLGDRIVRGR